MFDAVNHIIARHGIDAQTRQVGVYHNIARTAASIANTVGYRGINRQLAITDGLNIRRRNVHAPA
ncbi:hypothetical protein MUTS6_35460 [Escherichia coli]|nr:hypothetical protein MUTS6_35460 [Escherichia coli]